MERRTAKLYVQSHAPSTEKLSLQLGEVSAAHVFRLHVIASAIDGESFAG
jgi:hypothetical protein